MKSQAQRKEVERQRSVHGRERRLMCLGHAEPEGQVGADEAAEAADIKPIMLRRPNCEVWILL